MGEFEGVDGMTEIRKGPNRTSARGALLAVALGVTGFAGSANAADWSTTFLSINQAEYLDNFIADEVDQAIRDSDFRLSTNTRLFATGRFEDGVAVRVGGRLLYYQHIDRTDQDSLGVGGFADVSKRYGPFVARFGYSGLYRRKDGVDQYTENEGSASLNFRPNRSYLLGARGVVGYRDFDDANFANLDQMRYVASVRAFWYPFQDATFVGLQGSFIRQNAEDSTRATSQYIITLRARHPLTDRTSLSGNVSYRWRDFDEGNPAIQGGLTRRDTMVQAEAQLDYDFSRNVTAFAKVGVLNQESNINNQSFTGPRAGVGVKLLFSTGR